MRYLLSKNIVFTVFAIVAITMLVTFVVSPGPSAHSAPLSAPADVDFGICSNIATRYPQQNTMDVPAETLSNLGVSWVREDFQFHRMEPQQGQYDWVFHDNAVDELTSRGINIIGLIGGPTPGWATAGNPADDFYPPDPQAFASFAQAVVSRYKDRIHYWEIWNEPDNAWYWKPEPNAAAYATLLKTVYPAIKQADPSAQVLSAGLVSPEPARSFLKEVHDFGAWDSFDIISLHPYTDPWLPEEGQIASAGLGLVQTLADQLGHKPIWVTEFGWSTGPADRTQGKGAPVSEDTQASALVRGMVLLRAGGAERVLSYKLKDTQQGRNFYGVIGPGTGLSDYQSLKPSYYALQTLMQQVSGYQSVQRLDLGEQQTVVDFESPGGWRAADHTGGALTETSAQRYHGTSSGKLDYSFSTAGNDYMLFLPNTPPTIADASKIGIWVYGDGSGHTLKIQVRDREGETIQLRLGFVGSPGWQFLSAPTSKQAEPGNIISGSGNGQIDFPATLVGLVLDDEPDSATGSGSIYLDDMTVTSGPEAYGVRFQMAGSEVVDVVWSLQGGTVPIWSQSSQAELVTRDGATSTVSVQGGAFRLQPGPSPVYLRHTPGEPPASTAPPAPEPTDIPSSAPESLPAQEATPTPAESPTQEATPGSGECFEETGYCMSGRIREYWHQHGGLPVFGYPIGPQQEERIEGTPYQVQWFERNRLELHPENAPPYDVLLGRLSEEILLRQDRVWQEEPTSSPQSGCRYFDETGYNVCGEILEAWRSYGLELDGQPGKSEAENLALFGLPLGDAAVETIEGEDYLVQWFERARFEVHPENDPPYRVLFGLLGNEMQEDED